MNTKSPAYFTNLLRRASTKATTNSEIKPMVFNRNPRNLEKLRLEKKPSGYSLDKKFVSYWHKLEIIPCHRYVIAQIVHNNQNIVVSASTNEWAIRKQLFSAEDKQAYVVLAKVFAERCLESGLTTFAANLYKEEQNTKVQAFMKILEEEGLILTEPRHFDLYDVWRKSREKKPWTVLED